MPGRRCESLPDGSRNRRATFARRFFCGRRRSRITRDFSAILPGRHSREGGNPEPSASSLQNVIPANAGIQRLQRHPSRPSFPRTRESRAFRARTFEVSGFPPSRE
ncbi:hypothetical protein [Lysobacter gummosus]|uniref:hypothetical protein n=1 Tax=Lysobacter gummosus TaxID=262324 RepID=UPI0036363BE3